jgi:hypothetical protein
MSRVVLAENTSLERILMILTSPSCMICEMTRHKRIDGFRVLKALGQPHCLLAAIMVVRTYPMISELELSVS